MGGEEGSRPLKRGAKTAGTLRKKTIRHKKKEGGGDKESNKKKVMIANASKKKRGVRNGGIVEGKEREERKEPGHY